MGMGSPYKHHTFIMEIEDAKLENITADDLAEAINGIKDPCTNGTNGTNVYGGAKDCEEIITEVNLKFTEWFNGNGNGSTIKGFLENPKNDIPSEYLGTNKTNENDIIPEQTEELVINKTNKNISLWRRFANKFNNVVKGTCSTNQDSKKPVVIESIKSNIGELTADNKTIVKRLIQFTKIFYEKAPEDSKIYALELAIQFLGCKLKQLSINASNLIMLIVIFAVGTPVAMVAYILGGWMIVHNDGNEPLLVGPKRGGPKRGGRVRNCRKSSKLNKIRKTRKCCKQRKCRKSRKWNKQ